MPGTQLNPIVLLRPDVDRPLPADVPAGSVFKPEGIARIDLLEIIGGVRSWVTVGTGGAIGPAGGDLATTYPDPTLNPSTATGGILGKTDVATAAVTDIFTVRHLLSTGAGAAGHGAGLRWIGTNAAPAVGDLARTAAIWTDASVGSEDSAWTLSLRRAGAVLAEMYRFGGDGGLLIGNTNALGTAGLGLANNSTVSFRNAANNAWRRVVNLTASDESVLGNPALDTFIEGTLITLDSQTVVLAAQEGKTQYQGATQLLNPQSLTSGLNQVLAATRTNHDVNTTGAATSVLLPAAAAVGDIHNVWDLVGSWNASNLTVGVEGGGTINGAATQVISVDYAQRKFRKTGATAWVMIA